jgi:hypothetical protein
MPSVAEGTQLLIGRETGHVPFGPDFYLVRQPRLSGLESAGTIGASATTSEFQSVRENGLLFCE